MSQEKETKSNYTIDIKQLKGTKFTKTEEDGKTTFSLEPAEGAEITDSLAELGIKPAEPKIPGTTVDDPPKGSIISASPPKNTGKPIMSKPFDSIQTMISDLYQLKKTDKDTEKALDKLWELAVKDMQAGERGEKKISVNMVRCIQCGLPVSVGSVCQCGWRARV